MKKGALFVFVFVLACLIPMMAFAEGVAVGGGTQSREDLSGSGALMALRNAWKDDAGNIIYPRDYAGMYLDEAQRAFVRIVNLDAAREAELRALVPGAEITFRTAKYSYAELKQLLEEIVNDDGISITVPSALSVGLNERDNLLNITVNVADEAVARTYYEGKYGDKVKVDTTTVVMHVPGGRSAYYADGKPKATADRGRTERTAPDADDGGRPCVRCACQKTRSAINRKSTALQRGIVVKRCELLIARGLFE